MPCTVVLLAKMQLLEAIAMKGFGVTDRFGWYKRLFWVTGISVFR
jgi:hypothetical protein